ncbi:DUF3099 domain-containing protein [Marinitenerispora sediminis]|uniref:DUF3099 domain-containing protein n=1 Tax=Marinitenerispora sediminis TaxID=1931232 RepID=A0A368TAG1_9ACTN|nr:DUF3099 domain-containing protein [Marinitenerispora sediminis]RCV50910.1 hypothetical protein DEF28_16795 [Marinitenerispora sediminis]RCV59730.1 hypothetical protein DEF23_06570 [Marinitenerispora sediminis]RCV59818.1 hypothetical protein DEF24_08660 [Marinitenerispora sediminis]
MKRRTRRYSWLMTVCLTLFIGSLPVWYLAGTGWALAMCAVAAVIPPFAVIIANTADPDDPADHDTRYGPNAE